MQDAQKLRVNTRKIKGNKIAMFTGEYDDVCSYTDTKWAKVALKRSNDIVAMKEVPGKDHVMLGDNLSYFHSVLKVMGKETKLKPLSASERVTGRIEPTVDPPVGPTKPVEEKPVEPTKPDEVTPVEPTMPTEDPTEDPT